jgi:hypothetical protein
MSARRNVRLRWGPSANTSPRWAAIARSPECRCRVVQARRRRLRRCDVEQVADTILKAFRMSQTERTARMKRMRCVVSDENVFWWWIHFSEPERTWLLNQHKSLAGEVPGSRVNPKAGSGFASLGRGAGRAKPSVLLLAGSRTRLPPMPRGS